MKCCDICGITEDKKPIINSKKAGKCLCEKHLGQFRRYGCYLDNNPISVFDKNKYKIVGDIAYVDCYDSHGNITETFMCDKDNVDIVVKYKWRIAYKDGNPYVVTGNQKSEKAYFHQKVLGKVDGFEIDHIDGNTLNNCKSNLRYANSSMQKINTSIKHTNSTGFKGIRYRKDTGKYGIDFQYNNVRIYPMNLSKREEAVFVRYNLEKAIYNEYRRQDYDEKILEEISLISPDRQLELSVYSNELINDFQRKLNEVS